MKDWKKEFTKQFTDNVIKGSTANDLLADCEDTGRLMNFIDKTLKAQRQSFIELVEGKMINKQVISLDEAGYNMALDDLLKEIKGE
jgi:hypothetical protein